MASFISLLDLVYPVGSTYISASSTTSPASRFGGTWTALSGYYLYANGASTPGGTLGSSTHYHEISNSRVKCAIGAAGGSAVTISYSASLASITRHSGSTWNGGYATVGPYSIVGASGSGATDTRTMNHHTPCYGETEAGSSNPYGLKVCMWKRTA